MIVISCQTMVWSAAAPQKKKNEQIESNSTAKAEQVGYTPHSAPILK